MFLTAKRVARYGLIGFIRNGFISLAAIVIMTITLFVVVALLISGAALTSVLKQLTDKVDVTVYFTLDATPDQIQQLQTSLQGLQEVRSVAFVSREQALSQFQERHKTDQLTMQALEELGANPLGASLEVRAKDPSQYEAIAKYLEAQQSSGQSVGAAIDKVNFYQNKAAIDRLSNIIATSRRIGIAVSIVLGLASILIAFNTIRLAIYTARDEIGVMNLVGASHWYVRGPFMVAGILYGIISGLVVMILLYPITIWLGPGSQAFLGSFNVYAYFAQQFLTLFLIVMTSGIALGGISSYLAVRRYLRT